ncbi:MAG: Rieske 2Fe-2S domain-containing protein [Chloroflexi bacterium]|nr:Rieske 2Fe-2S domain-containing protein [Chloroflexota bacterium]
MIERVAKPLAGFLNWLAGLLDAIYRALGRPGKLLQDLLNGTWLGHSLHAVLVDVVVGGATAVVFLDVLRVVFGVTGTEDAGTWVLALTYAAGVGAILSGWTDFKDTASGNERNVVGLHGIINAVGFAGFGFSLFQRLQGNPDAAFWPMLIGYAIISVGAYIGGHVVFKYGYMVNRNAFNRGKRAKEFTAVAPLADVPDGAATQVTFGTTKVVLVRRGDVVHALKDTCSHAGGPLSQGELGDGTITCPWHGSVFRLRDGGVVHGPAASRQVTYRTRIADGQVELQGPHD